ncbi:hypothetical protein CTI12_AA488470 [Artemisia annua]|uniref:Uncharacterized protein n=1 Tax=Artemisia annua TaxID=35608 RepID=A0A2U1LI58_ARTAN|nr:hypothetical protein CTI12_AA488470 [Artemisia annua]
MRAIKEVLGDNDDEDNNVAALERKMQGARMPPNIWKHATRELRGNQAYSNCDLAKVEDCYTQGLNFVSQNEKLRSCTKALMLCYSNPATTRISLRRMKEALGDSLMAAYIDRVFLKAQVRVAP